MMMGETTIQKQMEEQAGIDVSVLRQSKREVALGNLDEAERLQISALTIYNGARKLFFRKDGTGRLFAPSRRLMNNEYDCALGMYVEAARQ